MRFQPLGPCGGYIKSFATDDDGRVYAGGDDSSGIWASDDDGLTWRLTTGSFPDATGWQLVTGPGTVYAVDHYGRWPLLVTTDRAQTWTPFGSDLPSPDARRLSCLATAADDPDTLLVGTGFNEPRPGDGIWRSADGGRTWQHLAFAGHTVPHLIRVEDVFYATVLGGPDAPVLGLRRSADGGRTWEPAGDLTNQTGISVLADLGDGMVAAGIPRPEAALWISRDGEAWEPIGLAGSVVWDLIRADGALIAGTVLGGRGVLRSEDDGQTWHPSAGLPSPTVMGLGRNPQTGTVFASTFSNSGAWRSEDGGGTFSSSDDGLHASYITGLSAGPERGRIVVSLLGTYEVVPDGNADALAETRDGGRTWQRIGGLRAHGLCVARDPGDPSRILLGTFRQGLWLSTDDGRTFRRIFNEAVVQAVGFGAGGAVASRLDLLPEPHTALLHSSDGGESWVVAADGLHATCLAPGVDAAIWAAGSAGIARSPDGGRSWEVVRREPAICVAPDPTDPGRCLAGTPGAEVLETRDGGAGWTKIGPEVPPGTTRGVYRIAVDGDRVYVGLAGAEEGEHMDTAGGFFVSEDRGRSWTAVRDGLSTTHVWALDIDVDGAVLAGTYGGGVRRLPREPGPAGSASRTGATR